MVSPEPYKRKVSHHPPISVAVAKSELYTLNLESGIRTKFLGNSVEAYVDGLSHLDLNTTNEHYAWNAITYEDKKQLQCLLNETFSTVLLRTTSLLEVCGQIIMGTYSLITTLQVTGLAVGCVDEQQRPVLQT